MLLLHLPWEPLRIPSHLRSELHQPIQANSRSINHSWIRPWLHRVGQGHSPLEPWEDQGCQLLGRSNMFDQGLTTNRHRLNMAPVDTPR